MKEILEPNFTWKGVDFYKEEIEKGGIMSELSFFNDLITEKTPPHLDSGYGEPVLVDIVLDGKKTDIYHSDKKKW